MTATEVLAAARANPVGPYVPAREEWLSGWTGPVVASVPLYGDALKAAQLRTGEMLGGHEIHFRYGGVAMDADVPLAAIRLDLRRPECRDLLIRHGCPAWARDVPAAVWAWAGGVALAAGATCWRADRGGKYGWAWTGFTRSPVAGCPYLLGNSTIRVIDTSTSDMISTSVPVGWNAGDSSGPETGADGRACADLAALRAGCVLEEPDGWYVPLVGGGVGWWAR